MEEELISIIIPVYNIEKYLPRCLETIAAQSYRNLEIILVDDGSTDGSGAICDEFVRNDNRACVIHQRNQGLWAARNNGQRIAKGNYLMFVDGDDYMHLDAITTLYQAINHTKQYDIAIIDLKKTNNLNGDITSKKEGPFEELSKDYWIPNLLKGYLSRNVWNKLYRAKLIENIFANEYPRAQDTDFNIRVFLKAKAVVAIHREMYFWVQRSTSFMHQPDYWDIVYKCHVKMLYENYNNLTTDQKQYGHYLLSYLYKQMVFWKNRNYRKIDEPVVFKQCNEYETATRKAYWLNWRINPLEKIVVTTLLHSPRLTRWLMKVTKNY